MAGLHVGYFSEIDPREITRRVGDLRDTLVQRFERPGLLNVVQEVRREMKRSNTEKKNWHDIKWVGSAERMERSAYE